MAPGNRNGEEAQRPTLPYTGNPVGPLRTSLHERVPMSATPDARPIHVEMDSPIWLKLRMDLPPLPAEDILRWFTDPCRLAQWMGDEHEVDLVPGGRYAIRWTSTGMAMEGAVIVARPTEIVFSWAFPHEPDTPARVVMVRAAAEGATQSSLVIIHGPYRHDGEESAIVASEVQARAGHLEGWNAFLPVLRARLMETAAEAMPV